VFSSPFTRNLILNSCHTSQEQEKEIVHCNNVEDLLKKLGATECDADSWRPY